LERNTSNSQVSNKELIDCLRKKGLNINPGRQEDSTEFFERLIEEMAKELDRTQNERWPKTFCFENLLQANIIETIICRKCDNQRTVDHSHTTINLENSQHGRRNTTVEKKLQELLQNNNKLAYCTKCLRDTDSKSTLSYDLPEYLHIRVTRSTRNPKTKLLERIRQLVKPEKILNIRLDQNQGTAQFKLIGGIIHEGGANSGHYLYLTNSSQKWHLINDAVVTVLPENEAIRHLETNGVLLTYRKIQQSQNHYESIGVTNPTSTFREEREKKSSNNQMKKETHNTKRNQSSTKTQKTRFFRSDRTNNSYKKPGAIRKRRKQWKKIYIRKPENSFYDPNKNCYYIPRE